MPKADADPARRMRELASDIRKHQRLYYVTHKPSISDREFDRMLSELIALEREHPTLVEPDSPSRLVGSDLEADFPKFQHTVPVLSLANTYAPAEAIHWAEKAVGEASTKIIVQWKVDGATLVVYYQKGRLVRAVTRGSGQIGDDVTANALTIRSIPHVLAQPVDLVVRGEVYMTFVDFDAFNEQAGSIYANPRNTAAGSLKLKKSSEVAGRPLRWVAFDGHFSAQKKFKTDHETLSEMLALGLPVSPDNVCIPAGDIEATIAGFTARKDALDMPVDGLVLKIDDLSLREELGFTANSPKWATSLKFEPEMGETTVQKIEVFTGRTGRVTPRAQLAPVKLAGTTVTYATLHNADYIKTLGVKVGSRVRVSKRGEIIPAVEEVIDPGPGKKFVFPKKCPSCQSKLERAEDAVDWMCQNPECPDKLQSGIIFFCQRRQMDIDRLGVKIVENLWDAGLLRSIEDIYRLAAKKDKLLELEGFGEKSVGLLLAGIEKSKERDFRRVLPALGLREVGPAVTDILIGEGFTDVDSLIRAAAQADASEKFSEIVGIGPRTSQAIIEQFQDPKVLARIEFLKSAGLKFSMDKPKPGKALEQVFAGQTWCVTGSFEKFQPRDLALEEVRVRGGRTTSSVSSKTTHLLAGESAGSKLEKARKEGVAVVSEAEFLKLIGR